MKLLVFIESFSSFETLRVSINSDLFHLCRNKRESLFGGKRKKLSGEDKKMAENASGMMGWGSGSEDRLPC